MDRALSFLLVLSEQDPEIVEVINEYVHELDMLSDSCEWIVVNNGLGRELNESLAAALKASKNAIQILYLHRPADPATALSQGFRACSGEIIVVLPPYVQVDPREIAPMVEKVSTGELDCVVSWRHPRVDSRSAVRKSEFFNLLTRKLTGYDFHDLNSSLQVFRREVVDDVSVYGDLYRFIPILAARKGYRVGEVKVRHVRERVKQGDYRLGVYIRRLLDLLSLFFLTRFTSKPLRFFGLIGTGVVGVGLLLVAVAIVQWFLGKPLGDRPILVFSVVLVVLGAHLFSIGLLGELIIFTHARDLKEYNVERVFESEDD